MSWEQLLSIYAENAQHARDERLTTCPVSGDLLQTHPDGGLICPFDGLRF